MIITHAEDFCHGALCFIGMTFAEGVFRRFGEEKYAEAKDYGPEESDAHGDAPGGGVLDALGAIVDDVREEDADCDKELVAAAIDRQSESRQKQKANGRHYSPNNSAPDMRRRRLRLVERDQNRECTNA